MIEELDNIIKMEVSFCEYHKITGNTFSHQNLDICRNCKTKMLDLINNNKVFKKKKQNVNEKTLLKAKADYSLICDMATWSAFLTDYKQYEYWYFYVERFVNKHNVQKLPDTERMTILGTKGHPKTFEINYKTLEITEVEE
jgi:hypothetical protein